MNYLKLLEDGYKKACEDSLNCPPISKLDYLGDHIFNYTTYDGEVSELFALKTVEVIKAINNRTVFEYIKNEDNYKWYLLICNMPFVRGRIDWGTSIRGAWWDYEIIFQSCQLYDDEEQICEEIKFTQEEWGEFIVAIIEFVKM